MMLLMFLKIIQLLSEPATTNFLIFTVLINYLFISRESGMEGDSEGEKHPCVVAAHVPPTEDLAHNPCPDWESNR